MKKLFKQKKTLVFIVLLLTVLFLASTNIVVAAQNGTHWSVRLIGSIARVIVSALGWILAKLMGILVYVAQYNNFSNASVIENGWAIARDVANMFFVVVLLVIAFATILRVESYNYKKWLPKLVIMAILINFSKTICGLLIDISQVVMLTFVNSFSEISAGSLTEMLGIAKWQSLKEAKEVVAWEVAAAYVLAVIYAFIALAVIAAMIGMLVMRIIMIWVYVVLSPFAYLLASFPAGEGYSSRWWSEFSKNLIIGPVLAFFIWLSFASLGTPKDDLALGGFAGDSESDINVEDKDLKDYGTSNLMIKFVVSIAMLLGGMKIAQEIGGAAGSVAGKTFSKVKGVGLMGAGALGGVMGYNFAKRRVSSWRQDTKKRVQQKSDLIYEQSKGTLKGATAGAATGVVRGVSGLFPKGKDYAKNQEKIKQEKEKEQRARVEKKRHKQALYEAYRTGEYKDASGKSYKWNEKEKRYIDQDGNIATYKNKDGREEEVKKMGNVAAGFRQQYKSKTTKARALKNQINEEKITEKQKTLTQAGTAVVDLKRTLSDSSNSSSKRMAAALELAVKEGFKNSDLTKGRQEVSEAKAVFGNNEPMLKKFNENIDKRFAALNYDLTTEGGGETFKSALAKGDFDGYKQDASTVDKNMAKTLRDYSGKDFGKNFSAMMSLSKEHREKGNEALKGAKIDDLKSGKKLYDATSNEMNPYAKLLAKNGDIEAAFNNSPDSDTLNFDNKSVEALDKFLETASASDLDNLNNDYLDENKLDKLLEKKDVTASDAEIKNMKVRIEKSIVNNVDVQKVASLEHLDNNPELVRRYVGLVDKYGPKDKKDQIESNNVLKNIKPIT